MTEILSCVVPQAPGVVVSGMRLRSAVPLYVDHILHRDWFWAIHIHCFRQCEIVGSQILLYGAQPCDAGASSN